LTFVFLADQSRGAERRLLILRLTSHSAARQAQVRAKDFFGSNLLLKKVAIPCDFDEVLIDFYPLFILSSVRANQLCFCRVRVIFSSSNGQAEASITRSFQQFLLK